jgi:hypothetical protein
VRTALEGGFSVVADPDVVSVEQLVSATAATSNTTPRRISPTPQA